MKYLLLLLLFVPIVSFAQKKSEIKDLNIISVKVVETDFEEGKTVTESETKYDSEGRIIEEKEYDSDGKLTSHKKYEYDDHGNKKKEIHYKTNNKVLKTIEYKYKDGLKTERTVRLPDGKIKAVKKYIYQFGE